MNLRLQDESATLAFGGQLAKYLPQKGLIFLYGDLGAGKTTLVRGILQSLGHQGSTKSPTYTLVEPYQIGEQMIYHFDLYRLSDAEELEYMGMRDYLDEEALCFIEWPQKGVGFLPKADLSIHLAYKAQERMIQLEAATPEWQNRLTRLSESDIERFVSESE